MSYHGVQLAGTWRAPASGKLDELARAVGLRRGNCDAERLDRILTGHEGRTLLLDRVQEILELAAQRLLLPDVDFCWWCSSGIWYRLNGSRGPRVLELTVTDCSV